MTTTKEKIIFFDTTLRDGEQSPGATMNLAEKVRLAQRLELLGVDVIEAGFPAASDGDFEAVKAVAAAVTQPIIAGLARASKEDIQRAWDAIKDAKKPRIHTFIATSGIHMEHKLQMTPEAVIERAVDSVRFAKSLCSDVEFSAEDGSRSDRDFLCKIFAAVIEAGATTINLPDTVGYAIPKEFAALVRYVMENTPGIDNVVLSVHCHNDLGHATANTMAAIDEGARQIEVTVNGIGERAGNTSLEEVAMTIHTRREAYPFEMRIVTEQIYPVSRLVRMITGIQVQPNKAIVGANAFAHEAGIHQDGVLKNPMTYEIMRPEIVGLARNELVLGKHSGRHALQERLEKMGYPVTKEELEILFAKFKELADKKKNVQDEDLEALIAEHTLPTSRAYQLAYLNVVAGTTVDPTATVKLLINGNLVIASESGNGPIDAAFNSIAKLTGSKAELKRFAIGALTGGTDAQGEVFVKIQENGFVAIGKGIDPDIVTASAKAYINALNRLVFLKENPSISPTDNVRNGSAV